VTWLRRRPARPSLFETVGKVLAPKSTPTVMIEAARILEAYGGQVDRAFAVELRARALLLGVEGTQATAADVAAVTGKGLGNA